MTRKQMLLTIALAAFAIAIWAGLALWCNLQPSPLIVSMPEAPITPETTEVDPIVYAGENRIIIQAFPNRHIKTFHVRQAISAEAMARILDINGVLYDEYGYYTKFDESKFELRVYKGQAFDWDEIEPVVILILLEDFKEVGDAKKTVE